MNLGVYSLMNILISSTDFFLHYELIIRLASDIGNILFAFQIIFNDI